MKIEHVALWTKQLELLKDFYIKYFNATPNQKYHNSEKSFSSYFLSFSSGCRLELMQMDSIPESKDDLYDQFTGFIHIAISLGSEQAVDQLTQRLVEDGYEILSSPRTTGDGYYESCFFDPDGNRIELTV
ncbi:MULTISPECIES: VOC family protein [Vibrio]|uniref:VOC family protein n=1 Tax=Vibrio TaxID=662 RepID=UPI0001B9546B|nr:MULTISPECIES: VOC family protein [Vibrio]EEX32245.1 lactoylglutathione lyase [Vibrio coralliilyticus ATCC BAA-450]MCM5508247.1 VOC family protein [Vibrio sp. SCSIO 43169]MDE3897797.1 VOC family protein [Vibrio sp. CC007]QFT39455.1 Glyoxalase-like domain protein [Vibrio sp. THAF64]QGM36007.1 Glyoxalase-like domain protein [Vibrio sp. THAF191d]